MRTPLTLKAIRALLLAGVLAGPAGGLIHAEPAARQYHNGNFGFTLRLTDRLADYKSVTSPEGITLTSPDGLAVINIFGSVNESGKPLEAIIDQYKSNAPDAEFTYEWFGRNAAVLSGYQGGDIFYVRIAMSPDGSRVAVLNMIYAPEMKRQLDPVVAQLSTSLTVR
jgi:hypothetical protein